MSAEMEIVFNTTPASLILLQEEVSSLAKKVIQDHYFDLLMEDLVLLLIRLAALI